MDFFVVRFDDTKGRTNPFQRSENNIPPSKELVGTVRNLVFEAILMKRRSIIWLLRKRFWISF
jgi:hypothetical protein